MENSFLEYSYSVIYSRALPDARDGLKPVQRRILYMMGDMGLRPDKGHVKSARVVGEVMGKLHPHGDSAIYDALVRLAQPFSMRVPLVDGHGNFGSLDDGPAASRYTEARLAPAALEMIRDLDEDVVDFGPNYDNSHDQPLVLPSAFPNLLVNGGSGIAVGMATNMAPHNLAEVIAAARHLLHNPKASLAEIMEFVPGPDFPSGGVLTGLDGVREAYETGRGTLRVRARAAIEAINPRRKSIVITELPYQVGPEKVIEKIKQGVQAKKIEGISELNDFTDRKNGLRLVITVKTGYSPEAVLEQLYRLTPLEETFGINNVCLVDGQPQTLGLLDLLRVYLEHRISVVRRRSEFRLGKAKNRLHLVEGLLVAIADIDEVIQVIRSSDDAESAKSRLRTIFDLSELQAEYILELRLRRLTKFSRVELETEHGELVARIAGLEKLLASEDLLKKTVGYELGEVAAAFGDDRRTTLLNSAVGGAAASAGGRRGESLQIADTPCAVLLSSTGRLLRVDAASGSEPSDTSDGGTDSARVQIVPPSRRTKHDAVLSRVDASVRGTVAVLTSAGRVLRFTPLELPSAAPNSVQLAAGVRCGQYLEQLNKGEECVALLREDDTRPLALGTAQGVVKRVAPGDWAAGEGFTLISLKPGDKVVHAAYAEDSAELVFITSNAQLLRFSAALVRPQGRGAGGMAGIKLSAGAQVVAFNVITAENIETAQVATFAAVAADDGSLFAPSAAGSVKLSALADFPPKGRGTGGVRAQRLLQGESELASAWAGSAPLRACGRDGSLRHLPEELGKRDGSGQSVESAFDCFGQAIA
ncbi:MAG: DNA topoisomerase IV subunit A [Microbacteriaceae bacterium]|nr:DNA topoisomerase IV subunit A [Microbacteriaceae bacterium]